MRKDMEDQKIKKNLKEVIEIINQFYLDIENQDLNIRKQYLTALIAIIKIDQIIKES